MNIVKLKNCESMKKIIILLMPLAICCQKRSINLQNQQKIDSTWVINVSDTAYDYPCDTLYMWVNGKQVGTQSNIVNSGDSVRVYYNPGTDSTNTLRISLSGGKIVLRQYWDTSATRLNINFKIQ